MQTLWIADMMADYIISHKGEEYKIDLGLGTFITFSWLWWILRMWFNSEEVGDVRQFEKWEESIEEIKDILLERMWVYEDDIEEIVID